MADIATTCFRCNYDLRGVNDESPCPECGLLAGRSRPATARLRDSHPRWLRRLSIGVWLMLISGATALPVLAQSLDLHFAPLSGPSLFDLGSMFALDAMAVVFVIGVWLLGGSNRSVALNAGDPSHPFARRTLNCLASSSLLYMAMWHAERFVVDQQMQQFGRNILAVGTQFASPPGLGISSEGLQTIATYLAIAQLVVVVVCGSSLAILVFRRLRDLGRLLLSRRLAEYSDVIGVGVAVTLWLCGGAYAYAQSRERLGLDDHWIRHSNAWTMLVAVAVAGVLLFWAWAVITLVGFAVAFWNEARALRQAWAAADFSLVPPSPVVSIADIKPPAAQG